MSWYFDCDVYFADGDKENFKGFVEGSSETEVKNQLIERFRSLANASGKTVRVCSVNEIAKM